MFDQDNDSSECKKVRGRSMSLDEYQIPKEIERNSKNLLPLTDIQRAEMMDKLSA